MLSQIHSIALVGLHCEEVEVEVDVVRSMPAFCIVGLADTAVQEAKERIRSAIRNSGYAFPNKRIILNLAPANIRKQSPAFDLPMAIGILAASGQVQTGLITESLLVGELSLNGDLRHINGALSIALFAKKRGYKKIIVPKVNAQEAALVEGIEIVSAQSLEGVVKYMNGEHTEKVMKVPSTKIQKEHIIKEEEHHLLEHIKGQEHAKRALEVAAAGGHNIIFSGPPGSGKTMLAKALRSLLPNMSLQEAIEVTQIYSVAGLLPKEVPLLLQRPFRVIHHTASSVSIVGGGRYPRPGEVSLAHKGVLFFDELAEFPQDVLEVMRQPLEDREISVSRALGSHTFPASFTLIAAMNPCPCGFATDPEKECVCTEAQTQRYKNKISGPFMDRIDMFLEVPRLSFDTITSVTTGGEWTTSNVKTHVQEAREKQAKRFHKSVRVSTNAEMSNEEVKKYCSCTQQADQILRRAVEDLKLSARAYFRLLKLARTIADIEDVETIDTPHIAEALQYRRRF